MSNSAGPKITSTGLVLNIDPANPKSYLAKNDPYSSAVSLLLDFDGANGSTTFIDKSINNLTITANGNAQISTAQSKFGGTSGYFDGNGDYLTVANNSANAFGLGDFTIECWINFSALPGTNQVMGIANTMTSISSATTTMWWLGLEDAAGTKRLRLGRHGNGLVYAYTNWTPSLNTWYHIAITRSSSSVISIFIDGISQSVTTSGSNWANDFSATGIYIIGSGATFLAFNGYIDDFRTTKAARYTSNFTPPGMITEKPGILTDLKGKTFGSLTNGPAFSNVQGGIISFDSTDDWISLPASSSLTFGTGDFTIDVWYRPRAKTKQYPQLIGNNITWQANCWSLIDRHASTNPTQFSFHFYNYSASTPILKSTTLPSNNNWYNITITRIGTTFSMYINGALEATTTSAASLDGGVSYTVAVGGDSVNGGATIIDGNIGGLKIYKTKGLTADEVAKNYAATRGKFIEIPKTFTGLSLWLEAPDLSTVRQNSNATTSAVAVGDPVGYWSDKSGNDRNATQATSGNRATLNLNSRNANPSISFNGSQWVSITSPGVDFGTGDFTIECSIKSSDTSVLKTPLGNLTSGFDGGWQILQNNSKFGFGIGVGGGIETYDATITQGVWYDFAVCRRGTTLKTFLNGVNGSTITNSSNISQTGTLNIGWANESAQTGRRFNGEIQNVIIYKGFCKYF